MSEYSDSTYNIKTEIKQQQKHLSNKEISEIVVKYSSGISTYELAKEYGCHRRTISDNLKKQGITITYLNYGLFLQKNKQGRISSTSRTI